MSNPHFWNHPSIFQHCCSTSSPPGSFSIPLCLLCVPLKTLGYSSSWGHCRVLTWKKHHCSEMACIFWLKLYFWKFIWKQAPSWESPAWVVTAFPHFKWLKIGLPLGSSKWPHSGSCSWACWGFCCSVWQGRCCCCSQGCLQHPEPRAEPHLAVMEALLLPRAALTQWAWLAPWHGQPFSLNSLSHKITVQHLSSQLCGFFHS